MSWGIGGRIAAKNYRSFCLCELFASWAVGARVSAHSAGWAIGARVSAHSAGWAPGATVFAEF